MFPPHRKGVGVNFTIDVDIDLFVILHRFYPFLKSLKVRIPRMVGYGFEDRSNYERVLKKQSEGLSGVILISLNFSCPEFHRGKLIFWQVVQDSSLTRKDIKASWHGIYRQNISGVLLPDFPFCSALCFPPYRLRGKGDRLSTLDKKYRLS
jgi:hypothetical protein